MREFNNCSFNRFVIHNNVDKWSSVVGRYLGLLYLLKQYGFVACRIKSPRNDLLFVKLNDLKTSSFNATVNSSDCDHHPTARAFY